MNYEKITPETLNLISAIVGEKNVLTDAELAENFLPWIGRIYT